MPKYLKGVKKKGAHVSVPADDMDDIPVPWDTPRSQGMVKHSEPGDEWESVAQHDVRKGSARHMSDKGVERGMTYGYRYDIDNVRNKLGNPSRPPTQSQAEYRKSMRSDYTGQRYSGTAKQQAELEAQEKRRRR